MALDCSAFTIGRSDTLTLGRKALEHDSTELQFGVID
jgi:hypothetical protein